MQKKFAAISLLILAVYFLVTWRVSARVFTPTGDEPHYLVITHSLAIDGDISLLNNYRERHYRIFYPGLLAKRTTASADKKLEIPTFGLGMPLFLAPFYKFAFEHRPESLVLILRLLICFVAALGVYQLMLLCYTASNNAQATILVVTGAALSTPLLMYSSQFYPEIFALLLLVIALRQLQQFHDHHARRVVILSVIPGLLIWLHPKYLIFSMLLFAMTAIVLYRSRRSFSPLQLFHLLVTIAGIASFFIFLQTNYGSWSPNRIYGGWQKQTNLWELLTQEGSKRVWVMFRMFFGFWIDERFGMLVYAPMYLVFFTAVVWAWRNERSKILPAIVLFTVHYLAMCWGAPLGGFAPPARHFVVMIPFLLLPIVLIYSRWIIEQKLLFWTLIGAGIVTACRMMMNYRKIFANITWRNPDGGSEFWQVFQLDRAIPNLTMTNPEYLLIAVWVLAVLVLSLLLLPRKTEAKLLSSRSDTELLPK